MKSTLHLNEDLTPESPFPLLAKLIEENDAKDTVVLFTDRNTGVVVVPSREYEIGHFSTQWIIHSNKATWKVLPAGTKVTLTV